MPEEETNQDSDAQEAPSAPPASTPVGPGEAPKPKKVVPKVPKGKFKKPEQADLAAVKGQFKKPDKPDLSAAKGKFAPPKEGPIKKPPLDRFHKKPGINPKILYAIIGVVVVLVAIFLFFGTGGSIKGHPLYIKARNTLLHNKEVIEQFYGRSLKEGEKVSLKEGSMPKDTYGEEDGRETLEIENTIKGEKRSGSFKVKGVKYKTKWTILYLEVTIGESFKKVLENKVLTETGIQSKE